MTAASATTRAWLQIHACVVLWGFTAILGKLITLPTVTLTLYRMAIVVAVLCAVPAFWRGLRVLPPRALVRYGLIGVVVALHWLTFYGAIKLSNASATASCLALIPVFTTLIEAYGDGRRPDLRNLAFAVAAIPGVVLVVGGTPAAMHFGVAMGVLSALLGSVFSVLNKRSIAGASALAVTGLEIAAGGVFILVVAPLWLDASELFPTPSLRDVALLLALAIGCTLVPFALSLQTMRHLSAFSVALAVILEPVYSVLLAMLLLQEHRELHPSFYLGVTILMAVVLLYPRLAQRARVA